MLNRQQGYKDGFFAFLYPKDNECCARAVEGYRCCLRSATTFAPWTLEVVLEAIKQEGAGAWIDAVGRRYLGIGRIDGNAAS